MDRNRIVAGLDVHKDSVFLCIMRYDEAIIFEKTYGTLTTQLRQMRDDMLSHGVTECAMESTAVYWVPVWNELCDHMTLRLANPHFIKQLPGRKSDTKDAQWIAECQLKRLIRESFVPNPAVQDMRKLNRRIFSLNEDLTYNKNKLDAAMQRCGFRLSNYVSNTGGKSYQSVVRAISQGETDAEKLVLLVHGRTVNKHGRDTIAGAVTGNFSPADIVVIRQYLAMIGLINTQIDECQKALTAMCEEHFPEQYRRLQTIPGVKERAATAIIAETGADMSMFAKAYWKSFCESATSILNAGEISFPSIFHPLLLTCSYFDGLCLKNHTAFILSPCRSGYLSSAPYMIKKPIIASRISRSDFAVSGSTLPLPSSAFVSFEFSDVFHASKAAV